MPHVASSPADLLTTIHGAAHLDGDLLVIDDEARFRGARDPRPRLDRGVQRRRGRRPRPRSGSSGRRARPSARRRRASRTCTAPEPAARSTGSRSRPSTCAPRSSTWRATVFEAAAAADVGAVILELARSEQTYTFQRPIDYSTSVLAGAIAAGWRVAGLHPGRPLPVQRQEVRRRSRGDDRGDPTRVPDGDRGRLPQHRHRLVDAGRPVEADRRGAAARELPAGGRADGPHPDARVRRRDGQRRRRDRRGRHEELDRRGAARLPRRLPPRARRAIAGRDRDQQGERPDRDEPRRRPAARRRRRRGEARLRGPARARRRRPRSTGWPARSSTGPRRSPTSCSTGSRPSRRRRSTSRPGSRTRCTSTRPSRTSCTARSRRGASATRSTSARTARPTSSSSTRRARRRSGRSSGSSGTSRPRTRSSPRSGARSPTSSPSSG